MAKTPWLSVRDRGRRRRRSVVIMSLDRWSSGSDMFNGVLENGIWLWALRGRRAGRRGCSMSQMLACSLQMSWTMPSLMEREPHMLY